MFDKQFWLTSKNMLKRIDKEKQHTELSCYPIVAVLWLNQVECFYQSLCLVGQFSTRKLRLCKAANRHPYISLAILKIHKSILNLDKDNFYFSVFEIHKLSEIMKRIPVV